MARQQILQLWLHADALDTAVWAWAFYDGTGGQAPLPDGEPPYPNGVAALEDGWFLIQAPCANAGDAVNGLSPTRHVFERRIG